LEAVAYTGGLWQNRRQDLGTRTKELHRYDLIGATAAAPIISTLKAQHAAAVSVSSLKTKSPGRHVELSTSSTTSTAAAVMLSGNIGSSVKAGSP